MKKAFKRISLVALSALMVGTATVSLASCGEDETISVFIFAGVEDQETNTDLINNWAENYAQKLIREGIKEEGFTIKTSATFQSDTTKYFSTLANNLAAGTAPDVFYVSPKYVKAYATVGYVLDLTDYIDFDSYAVNDVFSDAVSFYSYDGTTVGAAVTYDETQKKFLKEDGTVSAIYGLPKDYSSFGLAYNANYFTEANKKAYTSTKPLDADVQAGVIKSLDGSNNIINIGVPTTYFPYNFYQYSNYTEALSKGDPVAEAAKSVGGYTVTIPGFPGEKYDKDEYGIEYDKDAPYDDSIGYITYTYAEYGAVTWALTYYWSKIIGTNVAGVQSNVYGNDQYETATYYLLPWLDANDANYINSTTSANGTPAYQSCTSGTYTSTDGRTINYGFDSDAFIETYGAFTAYGSDWNGNSYYVGDGNNAGGYDKFKEGNCLFYGKGTWDTAGFNECDPDILTVAYMPNVVSEKYSLYSKVKDAYYKAAYYMDGRLSATAVTPKTSYSQEEIIANQEARQTVWSARMDSVGYGVNGKLANDKTGWKAAACADLVANLTIDRSTQVELTLAGAQLPNYADQCVEYLYKTGDFASIITPDNDNYHEYFEAAKAMVDESSKSMTVADFMKANYPNLTYNSAYANWTCKKVSGYTRAYQALNVITFDYDSRNISIRMSAGTNAVTDSCMYTFTSAWLTDFGSYREKCLIAYTQKTANSYSDYLKDTTDGETHCTPAALCKWYASVGQTSLNQAIAQEEVIINSAR